MGVCKPWPPPPPTCGHNPGADAWSAASSDQPVVTDSSSCSNGWEWEERGGGGVGGFTDLAAKKKRKRKKSRAAAADIHLYTWTPTGTTLVQLQGSGSAFAWRSFRITGWERAVRADVDRVNARVCVNNLIRVSSVTAAHPHPHTFRLKMTLKRLIRRLAASDCPVNSDHPDNRNRQHLLSC